MKFVWTYESPGCSWRPGCPRWLPAARSTPACVLPVDQERTGEAVQHLGDAAEALYVPVQNAGIEREAGDVIELRARLGAHYLAPCCCRIVGVLSLGSRGSWCMVDPPR